MIFTRQVYGTIKTEVKKLPQYRPYELMVHKLQAQLERTSDEDDRLRIERDILYFLGLRQVTRALDRIASSLEKLANGGT